MHAAELKSSGEISRGRRRDTGKREREGEVKEKRREGTFKDMSVLSDSHEPRYLGRAVDV